MRVLVTVGSTRFDSLVAEVLTAQIIALLRERGYNTLVIQAGNSTVPLPGLGSAADDRLSTVVDGLEIQIWRFKSSLSVDIADADLIISHAGMFLFWTF